MRTEILATIVASCVCLIAFDGTAESRPVKRGAEPSARTIQGTAVKKPKQVQIKTTKKTANKKIARPAAKGLAKTAAKGAKPGTKQKVARLGHPMAAIARVDNPEPALVSGPPTTARRRPMFGWPALVVEARKYLGTNPTNRSRLWCATFMNLVLAKVGYAGTGSDAARSFASYGKRVSEPRVGAIAVLTRGKRGGHVGVVTGIDTQGNPIIISGNHGRRVAESAYPRKRVIAYVVPVGSPQPTRYAALASAASAPRTDSASDGGIASPIAELLKAINDESPRNARAAVQPVPQPVQSRPQPRAAAAPAPVPHRVVQQVADAAPQPRAVRYAVPQQRDARRSLPLDPALARLFGVGAR